MKRFVIPVVIFVLLSCDNKPIDYPDDSFEILQTEVNVKSVTYKWDWSSFISEGDNRSPLGGKHKYRDIVTKFEIEEFEEGGDATAYGLINKTGMVCDVYTYKNGKPDLDPKFRTWVISYSGDASRVNVEWSGTLKQTKEEGTATVEILFQVYGDGELWPSYSNNIRPQNFSNEEYNKIVNELNAKFEDEQNIILELIAEEDDPDEIKKLEEKIEKLEADKETLLEEALKRRMVARYFNTVVLTLTTSQPKPPEEDDSENEEKSYKIVRYSDDEPDDKNVVKETVSSLQMSASGTYEFPKNEDGEPKQGITYRMQLFARVFSADGNFDSHYEITDGRLKIEFE